jgi:Ca-activated chloride channel family protein
MDERVSRRRLLGTTAAGLGGLLAGCTGMLSNGDGTDDNDGETDDWQYTPQPAGDGGVGGAPSRASGGGDGGDAGGIGLSAGGAKDIATFRRNVEEGYLPIPESLSYEGLFYDYYFETGGGACERDFCPQYAPAVTADPLSGETERYVTVGLDSGIAADEFERKRLNLVVVLDISGSMSASFSDYYYDRYGNRRTPEGNTDRPKIDVAKDALVALTEQLREGDRLGIVLYDDRAALAKPLRPVEATDMDAIREHIREDVQPDGGTDLSAGIETATAQLEEYADADPTVYENRAVALTDAMPNLGETSAGGLRGTLADNAERGLHTTFVGVGVDFNADLVDRITAIRGANYYGVHSAEEFERRLGEEFKYMVTPLVYDLELELDAEGYDIRKVYGSTAAEEATGRIARVNTLFASPTSEGRARGGVVLVQLARQSDEATVELTASWEDRTGEADESTTTIEFPAAESEEFANSGVRKAVLLSRYADLLKNWMVAEREGDAPEEDSGIAVPPEGLGQWEQQSAPLTVSEPYPSRMREFREYYRAEADRIGDDALDQESEMLTTILDAAETGS